MAAETVSAPPEIALESIGDLEGDVRESIARIRANPFIPHKESVRGFVYEVETGRLREVRKTSLPVSPGLYASRFGPCQGRFSCDPDLARRPHERRTGRAGGPEPSVGTVARAPIGTTRYVLDRLHRCVAPDGVWLPGTGVHP